VWAADVHKGLPCPPQYLRNWRKTQAKAKIIKEDVTGVDGANHAPGVHSGAARSVLEMGMQMRAAHDVEERLRSVEQRLLAEDPGRLPK
jgi:hypothetical protein